MSELEIKEMELSNLQRLAYDTNELHRTGDLSMKVWRDRSRRLSEMIMQRQNWITDFKAKKWREDREREARQFGLFDEQSE